MPREFKLPDLGEGVHEGQIMRLFVAEGDDVIEDQPLMEVETDKAAVEIPSPFTGRVEKIHITEQQVVNVGDVLVTFGDGKGSINTTSSTDQLRQTNSKTLVTKSVAKTQAAGSRSTHKPASPAIRKLARKMEIDLNTIHGTGPGGRITRNDLETSASSTPTIETQPLAASRSTPSSNTTSIPKGDSDQDSWGTIRRAPITRARKTIAANMTQSWSTIPHVTDTDDADVTELDHLRRGYPASENDQRKITMLAFVIRAVGRALQQHPVFNAYFDAEHDQIIYREYINIAVGVHTERGLIAPVIRDADRLTIPQISDALNEMTEKSRAASFAVNDTRGGTYTISNAGAFGGSRYSTPIITPGQCAVLALGRTRTMPWIVNDEIQQRLIMPLSHSFDHRIVDGGEEIAFLQRIIGDLENPARMLW